MHFLTADLRRKAQLPSCLTRYNIHISAFTWKISTSERSPRSSGHHHIFLSFVAETVWSPEQFVRLVAFWPQTEENAVSLTYFQLHLCVSPLFCVAMTTTAFDWQLLIKHHTVDWIQSNVYWLHQGFSHISPALKFTWCGLYFMYNQPLICQPSHLAVPP